VEDGIHGKNVDLVMLKDTKFYSSPQPSLHNS
jgi:hypothetical protein